MIIQADPLKRNFEIDCLLLSEHYFTMLDQIAICLQINVLRNSWRLEGDVWLELSSGQNMFKDTEAHLGELNQMIQLSWRVVYPFFDTVN